MTDSDRDVRWMTYAEAAAVLGVNPESIAKRMRRGGWAKRLGNDKKPRVAVPVSVLPPVLADVPVGVRAIVPDNDNREKPTPLSVPDKALADAVAAFREAEAHLRAERDAALAERDVAAAQAARERSRADQAEGEAAALRHALAHERAQVEAAAAARDAAAAQVAQERGRADRAEGEADGLKTAAEHLHEVAAQARRDATAAQDRAVEAKATADALKRAKDEAEATLARLRARGLLARLRNRP